MTPAIDTSIAALRALLTDDMDTFRQLHGQQNADERRAFAAVLTAAFNKAVADKFGAHASAPDVIEFVADAQARYVGPDATSAEDAELVIRAALGEDDLIDSMDAYTFGAAQTAILIALAHDDDFFAEDVKALLAMAERQARSFFERQSRR
ncbi:MAG TPA: hypothetical protein VN969_31690 [Streptosporangiaceae bacterium]|nr:hypothetical protein [Streptosporangiaceae bacterium]